MTNTETDLLVLINDVARMLRTEADRRARAHGMTRAQWIILSRLDHQPGLSQRELAEIIEVEPITVARLVDRLVARGLIERRPDPADRRIWRLHLLPGVEPVLDQLNLQRESLLTLITGRLDPDAIAAATHALLAMRATLSRRTEPRPELEDVA